MLVGIICLTVGGLGLATSFALRRGVFSFRRVLAKPISQMSQKDFEELVQYNTKFFTGGFEPIMGLTEALYILGLSHEEAKDYKNIHNAHKRVILRNHPDKGGSNYLTAKITEAKHILESKLPNKPDKFAEE